jgi:hypothetical protein
MRFLNAPPIVLRVLLAIEGVLYLIAGTFITIYGAPQPTTFYAMAWVNTLFGFVLLVAAWQLPPLIAKRSHFLYLAIGGIVLLRLVNTPSLFRGDAMHPAARVGLVVDLLLAAYLWSQVRRLRGAAA